MTVLARVIRLKDIHKGVKQGIGAFEIAVRNLEEAAAQNEHDLVTGYAGATAIKHLRQALRDAEKAKIQLDSIVPAEDN